MTAIDTTSAVEARLLDHMGSDDSIIRAMLVSTKGADSVDAKASTGRINFLMRNRHGTPFEHNAMTFFVAAPIFVFREFHRHRIGFCLAGDTEVWCETISSGCGRTLRKEPISALWEKWHEGFTDSLGRKRRLDSSRNFTVRVLNEETGRFELGRVIDIYRSGPKPLLMLTTTSGKSIRCSVDHAIYTNRGWVRAGDLRPGHHRIAVNGKVPLVGPRETPPALRRGIGVWTTMQRRRLIPDLFANCYLCKETFSVANLELDHIVPVAEDLTKALDPDNLAPACRACHQAKTNGEQGLASGRGGVAGAKYQDFEIGSTSPPEPTYDLAIEGPWHGFVANGIVVHNSYNEMSGRYKELPAVFYVPGRDRPLIQVGKPGEYRMEAEPDEEKYLDTVEDLIEAYDFAYAAYERIIARGHAKEIARACLPVAIFSEMYVTCNARSLMSFLSLRVDDPEAMFPSKPQWEIQLVAQQMERAFAELFPLTYQSYTDNKRVAP